MALSPVTMGSHFFCVDGRPFLPIGAHWVPAKSGLQWPLAWDEADLEADFAKMQELGFNTVRFDLFWAWFEPRPGDFNPVAFEQLDTFIHLAHRYQIYLHPALFIGGEVGEAFWDVPWRQGRHPHADADMLRLQTDHAAAFARRYQGEPAILAWDLTDEPPFWIVADQTTDAMAINWTRLVAGALRRYDPAHLLCVGTSMEDLAHGPFRPDNLAEEVDFFSVHPYSIYTFDRFPDPMLSERSTYAGAFEVALSGGARRPVMIHEFGASSAQYSPERIAHFDRVTLFSGLAAGACGFLPWCYTDAAPEQFQRTPYRRAPHETQFGLTTWDRQDRPRGQVLRQFSQLLSQLDLTDLRPAAPEASIIVPQEWAKPHGDFSRLGLTGAAEIPYTSVQDGFETGSANLWLTRALLSAYVLARRAGLQAGLPREYADWRTCPLVLLPSPLTSTERPLAHVHTPFWQQAAEYVRAGGTLYASLCADAAIPEMAALFGASLADHAPAREVTLTFVEPFGDLKRGDQLHYQADPATLAHWPATLDVDGGQILATDQDGRPALVTNQLGQGKTLLCAYPLETYLGALPAAFEGEEHTHRLIQALCQWAGVAPLFTTGEPSIEAGALVGDRRGYTILANHRANAVQVLLRSSLAIEAMRQITTRGKQDLPPVQGGWQIDLPAFGGAILEWRSSETSQPIH